MAIWLRSCWGFWVCVCTWHPEHAINETAGDAFSEALFRALVRAAAGVVPQAT